MILTPELLIQLAEAGASVEVRADGSFTMTAAPVLKDESAERRRAADRERKAESRALVRRNPQTSTESSDKSDPSPSLSFPPAPPLSPSPTPPSPHAPTPTHPHPPTPAAAHTCEDEPKPAKAKRQILHANDEEWLKTLEADPTYAGIDLRRELGKMQQYCNLNRKLSSRRRFLNWIGRIEKPMTSTAAPRPLSPAQREMAAWFGRLPDDWTAEECQLWDSLPMVTDEDMQALRWFYTASGYGYLRQSLPSLLQNMRKEIDKAKNYTPPEK